MNYLKLAWRNLWRNRKRTIITISSITFSVLCAVWMRSMQEGSYDSMIDSMVKYYSGYLQIQDTAYWEEKTLENSIKVDPSLFKSIKNIEDVELVNSRLESFALSAYKTKSKAVFVMGIEPESENDFSNISDKIIAGDYIKSTDNSVLIAQGLSKFLEISLNDTLVLISQGYHAVSAAGKYAIKGIFKHPLPDFNKRLVVLNMKTAQDLFSADDRQTPVLIMLKNHYKTEVIQEKISSFLPPQFRVMSWEEMQPELVDIIEGDRAGGLIMLAILYLVIAFGIFGTAIMMINERKREFGVINAVGMKKSQINKVLFIETLLLGIIGCLMGMLFSLPFVLYFFHHPIPMSGDISEMLAEYGMEPYLFFSKKASLFINQALIVFIICLIVGLISAVIINRMKMLKALRA